MAFLSEPAPPRGTLLPAAPGIARVVAPNPGPFTYHGTNSWLLQEPDGLTVIDPGPDDADHIGALAAAGRVARILLTHTHPDHLAGAPRLRALTGAPIHAWTPCWQPGFTPDFALSEAQLLGALRVLHTPGHASDHVCLALEGPRILFTGDHVMSWSTSVVSPPDGDMGAYMASLRRLIGRGDALFLGAHGPPLPEPERLVRALLTHRAGREAAILGLLARGAATPDVMVEAMYVGTPEGLKPAARRTVLAHLLKLAGEGRVEDEENGWRLAGKEKDLLS